MTINQDRLNEFLGRFVNDLGATFHAGMVVISENSAFYRALTNGPALPAELAPAGRTPRHIDC